MLASLSRLIRFSALCSVLIVPAVCSAQSANEREQLRLILTQLDHIEAIARQSQQTTSFTGKERFSFDYLQLTRDIQAVRTGIERYMSPTRAQPREVSQVQANYQQDRGSSYDHD